MQLLYDGGSAQSLQSPLRPVLAAAPTCITKRLCLVAVCRHSVSVYRAHMHVQYTRQRSIQSLCCRNTVSALLSSCICVLVHNSITKLNHGRDVAILLIMCVCAVCDAVTASDRPPRCRNTLACVGASAHGSAPQSRSSTADTGRLLTQKRPYTRRTTSMPAVTRPKATLRPSMCGAGATVT
jgi:hypothetical protein